MSQGARVLKARGRAWGQGSGGEFSPEPRPNISKMLLAIVFFFYAFNDGLALPLVI